MKLVKTLLATTLAFDAFSTFAATDETTKAAEDTDKVIVSTQESAPSDDSSAAEQPAPITESATEASAPASPQVPQ